MGLDTVELVMDVEESFGVKIPDDDAQQIITVGDLFEFVKSQTELAPAGTCLTAATFYDIRKGFSECGISQRFGPSTPLADIVPDPERRSFWAKLARITQFRLPDLVRPSWLVILNGVITCSVSIFIALTAFDRNVDGSMCILIGVACLCFVGSLTAAATRPFATRFATDFGTFRGLSERVLALNASAITNRHGAMGPNDIWVVLRELIVNQLGVDADEVTPTASFVKDLGCD